MASLPTLSSLQYPWPDTPAPGTTLEVAPGVRWLSMPLPFQLDHINLWMLEDDGGWTIVDTGIGDARTRSLWEQILSQAGNVNRVILTHYHPDHAGNAGWLCKRFGVDMWTTQGEYLTAHAVRSSGAGYTSDAVLSVFNRNGLDAQHSVHKGMVFLGQYARGYASPRFATRPAARRWPHHAFRKSDVGT